MNAVENRTRLPFALYVRNDNHRPRLIKLIATCGALDFDDPTPTLTATMPDEDWLPRGIRHPTVSAMVRPVFKFGDYRRPQAPACLAEALAKADAGLHTGPRPEVFGLWTPGSLALALTLPRPFRQRGK